MLTEKTTQSSFFHNSKDKRQLEQQLKQQSKSYCIKSVHLASSLNY